MAQHIYTLNYRYQLQHKLDTMALVFKGILLLTILFLVSPQGHLKSHKPPSLSRENKTQILDDNHFTSKTSKVETFIISDVVVNKPLATTISPKKRTDPYNNAVTLTLKSGTEEITCHLKSYQDLCVLEKVPTLPITLKVECQQLPCDVTFTTSQSPLLQTLSEQQLDQLYKLDDSAKHQLVMFSCDNPDIVDYESMLSVYSNQPYTRVFSNNVIYYMFTNIGKGYLLVESEEKARRCTTMMVSKTPDRLENRVTVRDFVGTSTSNFAVTVDKGTDLRIDLSFHQLDKEKVIGSELSVQLSGSLNGSKQVIHKYIVQNIDKKPTINVNTIFPQPLISSYTDLSIQLTSSKDLLLATIVKTDTRTHDIDIDEMSLFTLKSGESLEYKLLAEPQNDNSRIQIELINDNNNADISTKTCSIREGCEFKVTAKGPIQQGGVRLNPLNKEIQGSVEYIEVNQTFTGKIREAEILYFVHHLTNKTDMEIMINSPNVLVYVGDKACPRPSQACNNYSGNSKQQIQIEEKMTGDLYIAVEGLDSSRFTLRILENVEEFIELKDGEPFTYTLKQQNQIGFIFKIKDFNSDVKFNLVAPLNSLNMYVNNNKEEISADDADLISYSGDVTFKKSDLKDKEFTLLLSKIHNETLKQNVHFAIIASTSSSILPLEPSIPHYQQLHPHKSVRFIFEFKLKSATILNVFVSGVEQEHDPTVVLKVVNDLKELPSVEEIDLKKVRSTIDLEEYGDDLCGDSEDDYCELYLEFSNSGEVSLDITITLLTRDAIVQLKDGIWESFPIKEMTPSFHFYFLPKHQNNSITLLYKSTFKHLQLTYKLWTITKDKALDMQNWPFPSNNSTELKPHIFNPMQFMSISSDNIQKCWPSCVVLFSFLKGPEVDSKMSDFLEMLTENDHFNIMASNDMISLMQREKIELVLHDKEEKELIVDLKHVLEREHLTFFSYTVIGEVKILAALSSNSKPRRPTDEDHDYSFGGLETQINVGKLKGKLDDLGIQNDNELYLRIVIFPQQESKITFEYSTRENLIKQLYFQSFETIKLTTNQQKLFQLIPTSDYKLKIVRVQGFPMISVKECDNKDLESCIEDIDTQRQMSSKTEQHEGKRSTNRIVVVKVVAHMDVEMDIYAQTPYGQVELKQGQTVTDFGLANETMRYSITGIRLKETVLTVNVLEGNPTVRVFDYDGINYTKTKKEGGLIHIPVPPKKVDNSTIFRSITYSYGLNSYFSTLHVQVSDSTMNTFYTIHYTSGDRGLTMQDGLPSTVVVEVSKNMTFYYRNSILDEEPLVIISADTADELKELQIKISYTKDNQDGEEMQVESPQMKAKTPRPTMVFRLPKGYNDYEIFLINNSPKVNITATVLVNQVQILMLPYNIEYPVVLKEGESQSLMTEVNNEGYLLLTLKKCDAGAPTIAYTFDKEAFSLKEFTFESQIRDEMRSELFIKGTPGTLYMEVTADIASSFSLQLNYYPEKKLIPKDNAHPGNNGILEYELLNSIEAEISFTPLQCEKSSCPKTTYSYIASTSVQSAYSQSLCPSYFLTYSQNNKPLESKGIKVQEGASTVKFPYKLIDQISYVTVKATTSTGKEYVYKPVQIVTIWGHIARTKHYHIFFLFLVAGLGVCCVLLAVRRWTKPGYRPLREVE